MRVFPSQKKQKKTKKRMATLLLEQKSQLTVQTLTKKSKSPISHEQFTIMFY